jgi:hypothetical protein
MHDATQCSNWHAMTDAISKGKLCSERLAWDAEAVQYASQAWGNILRVMCWTTLEPDLHMRRQIAHAEASYSSLGACGSAVSLGLTSHLLATG